MKKILVTGSNGYIGNALVLALLNRKKEFTVRAAARRGSILNSKSFETVRLGSLEESPDYVEAFKGCDVLIHCASRGSMRGHEGWLDEAALHRINVLGTVHMAREAHRAGISRFVFLSSLQVNGPETPPGRRFYADSLPRPKSPVGKALLEAEKELTRVGEETGMEIVIVRPPLIYGPDCQNLFGEVKIMVDYCLPLPLRSCKRNHRSLVGIDNLVDFLICCATHPDAANETFLVSDGVDLSTLNILSCWLKRTIGRVCCGHFRRSLSDCLTVTSDVRLGKSSSSRAKWPTFIKLSWFSAGLLRFRLNSPSDALGTRISTSVLTRARNNRHF